MAASRRLPVVSLYSSVSDSPCAARATICSMFICTHFLPEDVTLQFVVHDHPRLDEWGESVAHKGLGVISGVGEF